MAFLPSFKGGYDLKNKFEIHGNLTIIHLNHNQVTFIDTEDLEKLQLYKGTITCYKDGSTYYTRLYINGKRIPLHAFILGSNNKKMIDHKNGDGLDNRKKNLRSCTNAENSQNRLKKSESYSGHRNVRWKSKQHKFEVSLEKNGKAIYGGAYDNLETAKQVAAKMRKEVFPFATN